MNEERLQNLLKRLISLPSEKEWVEFKLNNYRAQEIGEYISALANSACLHNRKKSYLVFGIEDRSHNIKGTKFKPRQTKVGNEDLENWLARLLNPRIDFLIHEFQYDNEPIVLIEIDAAGNTPVEFSGTGYIRVGSCKDRLKKHTEKARKIWTKKVDSDWSAKICEDATIHDLEQEAIEKARQEYKRKNPNTADDVDSWDDITFMNKAKITINGKITNTAILLLGKPESDHFILPAVAKISWILKDEHNSAKDYEHFSPPFLLNVDNLFKKIRNLKHRYMPDGTLFPIEINQYDNWVIREALHNCIAHQDYELKGKINVVEKPDELTFTNPGDFIPGAVESVIQQDAPQDVYRNPFLAQAMVNLNMIDTIGSGIKKMFETQKQRFFPMPDYDLSDASRVVVTIEGKILDENYTRMLTENADLDLETVILLDKAQKRIQISKEEHKRLKARKLIEGRYPSLYVSSHVAAVTGDKAKHIKNKGLDDDYYQTMVLELIKKYGSASRKDINDLLMEKLPDVLNKQQRLNKINRLLSKTMSAELGLIENVSTRRRPVWVLKNKENEEL